MKTALLGLLASLPALNILRVASAVKESETVVINGTTFEADTDNIYTAGRVRVNLSASGATAASLTLTSTGVNVTDADTVTIGTTVYRFKNTLAAAYDVKIAATAALTLANLKAAINATGVVGTDYFAGTLIHPSCTGGTLTATTLLVTANVKGTAGNAIVTGEVAVTLSWTAAGVVLAGGVDPTAGEFTTALQLAIASVDIGVTAVRVSANEILIYNTAGKPYPWACTETLTGTNNAWASATMYGGDEESQTPFSRLASRAVNAEEAALQTMRFVFRFPPLQVTVQTRTSAGALKTWDGAITVSGNVVTVDSGGSTDLAQNDVVTVLAVS